MAFGHVTFAELRGHCPIQPNADGFAPSGYFHCIPLARWFHAVVFQRHFDPLELSRDRRVAEQKAVVVGNLRPA